MYTKEFAITDEWEILERIRARAEKLLGKILADIDDLGVISATSYYVCAGELALGDDCRSVLQKFVGEFAKRGYRVEVLEDLESLQTAAYYFSVKKLA